LANEIGLASRAGIDGFALNFGAYLKEVHYQTTLEKLFKAATGFPDFKLVLSFDQMDGDESLGVITKFANHPNSLHLNGKLVVSAYGATPTWITTVQTGLASKGISAEIIPAAFYPLRSARSAILRSEPAEYYAASVVMKDVPSLDGYFTFGAGAPYDELEDSIRKTAGLLKLQGKTYMAGISPFYKGTGNNSRLFESEGFVGMQNLWLAAINSGAQLVELVTWNDWNESTYLQPFEAPVVSIWNQPAWASLLDHSGFLGASRYYIDWFKAGRRPTIETDHLFYFFQLHPKTATAIVNYKNGALGRPKSSELLSDKIHFAAFLTTAGTLNITVGKIEHRLDLPAGVTVASIPMSLGALRFNLSRQNTVVADELLPLPITVEGETGRFNYLAREVRRSN
jgi:hypothetical protein